MLDAVEKIKPQKLILGWADLKWPLLFLLSMSLMGLMFPLGYILVPAILINRFRNDKYDFLIMLTVFFGGFGLVDEHTLPVKTSDLAIILSVIGLVIYRKKHLVRQTTIALCVYTLILLYLATFSEESMMIQIRMLRNYLFFVYFIVPIMLFSGYRFDMLEFFRKLAPYVFILCAFYIIDGFIINGWILLPTTKIWGDLQSTFFSPVVSGFGSFPRKYPPGLFLFILFAYPMARCFKLSVWQWLLIIGAFCACRTFTVITGVFATYILCLPNARRIAKYVVVFAVGIVAVYFIDDSLPRDKNNAESPLRIASSVDQLIDLREIEDDVDLAELGSGRMAQVLPKLELVNSLGKQMTGLGFLHPELTTNQKYIIENEFYIDQSEAEEVATGVEIMPVQIYVTIGWVGIAIFCLFFFYTFWIIRKLKYSFFYLSALFASFWFSLGGFAPLNNYDGLILCATAYSAVILVGRNQGKLKEAMVS